MQVSRFQDNANAGGGGGGDEGNLIDNQQKEKQEAKEMRSPKGHPATCIQNSALGKRKLKQPLEARLREGLGEVIND